MNVTDRQMDGHHTMTKAAIMHSIAQQKRLHSDALRRAGVI